MAGRQHETRPDREPARNGQIYDESRITGDLKSSENLKYSSDAQDTFSGNRPDDLKIDKPKDINVHFYMLSIMNEANKVTVLLQCSVLIYNAF